MDGLLESRRVLKGFKRVGGGGWSVLPDPGVGISRSMRKLITPKLVLIIITEYQTEGLKLSRIAGGCNAKYHKSLQDEI